MRREIWDRIYKIFQDEADQNGWRIKSFLKSVKSVAATNRGTAVVTAFVILVS
jgi:hypothetical protein